MPVSSKSEEAVSFISSGNEVSYTLIPTPDIIYFIPSISQLISVSMPQIFFELITMSFGHFIRGDIW